VSEDDVDWECQKQNQVVLLVLTVVEAKTLKRGVGALDNVLARETARVLRLLAAGTEEDLGGDDNVAAVPAELLDHAAHLELRVAVRVHLGVVEHVDAEVEGSLHELLDGVALLGAADTKELVRAVSGALEGFSAWMG